MSQAPHSRSASGSRADSSRVKVRDTAGNPPANQNPFPVNIPPRSKCAASAVDVAIVVVPDAAADAAKLDANVAVDVRATEVGDTMVAYSSDAEIADANRSLDAVSVDSGTTPSAKASGCGCDLGGRRGSSGAAGLLLDVGVTLATFRRRRTALLG